MDAAKKKKTFGETARESQLRKKKAEYRSLVKNTPLSGIDYV